MPGRSRRRYFLPVAPTATVHCQQMSQMVPSSVTIPRQEAIAIPTSHDIVLDIFWGPVNREVLTGSPA
eukprot:1431861-Pyramimonas_sp.AAC.1